MVTLVALTVSIPVRVATLVFYVAFRLTEDYLLTPKIVGRAVRVPGGVTVFAVLIGAALLGVVGARVAIPRRRGIAATGFGIALSDTG